MGNGFFSRITSFLKKVVDVVSSGNLERVRLINQFNLVFKEAYLQHALDRLCVVSTAAGNPRFKHSMSQHYFISGFKITINNDEFLTKEDFVEISRYIIESKAFVRQLMSLGYDTLIIKGRNHYAGFELALKEIADLQDYFLN